jgi:uncharacterized membrane protein YhiD involved in acid resistance
MWVVCAIGLAIGSGYYLFGSVTSAITILSLIGLKIFERRLRKDWYKEMVIVSKDLEGQFDRIQKIIDKYNFKIISFGLRKDLEKKEMIVNFRLRLHTVHPSRDLFQEVFEMEGVKRVDLR